MRLKMILMLLVLLMPITALAATITVGPSGCNYTYIWDALDVANSGDTIEVQSGIYHENVIVDKTIILCGNNTGSGMPIINANGRRSAVKLIANGTTLQGFMVGNSGGEPEDAGIKMISNNNTILNNYVAFNKNGIYSYSSAGNNIANNIISDNYDDGIYLGSAENNTFVDNIVQNNKYCGIHLHHSINNTIIRNVFSNNGEGLPHSPPPTIQINI